MKILHLMWNLLLGGAETMLVEIINRQVERHEVSLVVINSEISDELLGEIDDRVHKCLLQRRPSSRGILDLLKLNLRIYGIRPDIIHCHHLSMVKGIFLQPSPKVVTIHGDMGHWGRNLLLYDRIFSVSETIRQIVRLRSRSLDSTVVFNGVDFAKFVRKTTFNRGLFRIVQVSRLDHRQKGQDVLLEAVSILVRNFGVSNIKVDFIGDGESYGYLASLIHRFGLEPYCTLLGPKTRRFVYENLCTYDLLVQPSRHEGFGLTVVEAMAARVPVLVSNVEGPMEIIENGRYGDFFASEDARDCAGMIAGIIERSRDGSFLERIVEGYEFARSRFSIESTVSRYNSEYLSVCGSGRKGVFRGLFS